MKFLSQVCALLLLGTTEGRGSPSMSRKQPARSLSAKQMESRIRKGQVNKQALMRSAKPYSSAARRLAEENAENGQEEEFEINGLYTVQFESCLSLTIEDENLFDDDIFLYAANGIVHAQQSYIIFSVCYTPDCYYEAEEEALTFVTDIPSFFGAFQEFLPYQYEVYCQACEEQYDYCMGNMDEEQNDEPGEEGEDDREDEDGPDRRNLASFFGQQRRLEHNEYDVTEEIDCEACFAFECYEDQDDQRRRRQEKDGDDDDDEEEYYDFMDSLNWLDEMNECKEIEGEYIHYMQAYAGLMCNADGTGVEIGIFWDEDCQLYVSDAPFVNSMTYADAQYYNMSQEIVEFMFTNDFSCYEPEVWYVNPYEYEEEAARQEDENAEGEEEQEYQIPEAAEWCQALFNGQMEPLNLYDCGVENDGGDDADDDQDDDADDEGDEYDAYGYYEDWYSYQLSQEQLEDSSEVCLVVKALEGEYSTLYNATRGGSLYTYKSQRKNRFSTNVDDEEENGLGMTTEGIVALLVALVGAVVVGITLLYKKTGSGSDDKAAPLIDEPYGTDEPDGLFKSEEGYKPESMTGSDGLFKAEEGYQQETVTTPHEPFEPIVPQESESVMQQPDETQEPSEVADIPEDQVEPAEFDNESKDMGTTTEIEETPAGEESPSEPEELVTRTETEEEVEPDEILMGRSDSYQQDDTERPEGVFA